jgi:hypothetical protein
MDTRIFPQWVPNGELVLCQTTIVSAEFEFLRENDIGYNILKNNKNS